MSEFFTHSLEFEEILNNARMTFFFFKKKKTTNVLFDNLIRHSPTFVSVFGLTLLEKHFVRKMFLRTIK